MTQNTMNNERTVITRNEWKDYYQVQRSGTMNMWGHPLIVKFAPEGHWEASHEWFEVNGNTEDLVISFPVTIPEITTED